MAWVGRDQFIDGLRTYFVRHQWGNTQLSDLLSILEETSGRDLSLWTKEWLETAGINTLRPDFSVGGDGTFSAFAVVQEAPTDHPTLRSHRLGIGLYNLRDGQLTRTDSVELDITGDRTEVPEMVGKAQPDLVLLNDRDLTYTKLRLDERSTQTLVESIGRFPDSLPRALCWSATWDMTRDAELPAQQFVALVKAGLGAETDIGMTQTITRQAISALTLFTKPANRDAGLADFADFLWELAAKAEAGSDHQLAFTKLFLSIARTDAQLANVATLLSGEQRLVGLVIDPDLRWALLQRLVAMGRADDEAIDRELDRDMTASGQRQAAAARALRPNLPDKEDAWSAMVVTDSLPNALLAATVAGFNSPDQIELTRTFIDRYFERWKVSGASGPMKLLRPW